MIIAPTTQMLNDLSWAKFMGYAKEEVSSFTPRSIPIRPFGTMVLVVKGYSADRPQSDWKEVNGIGPG